MLSKLCPYDKLMMSMSCLYDANILYRMPLSRARWRLHRLIWWWLAGHLTHHLMMIGWLFDVVWRAHMMRAYDVRIRCAHVMCAADVSIWRSHLMARKFWCAHVISIWCMHDVDIMCTWCRYNFYLVSIWCLYDVDGVSIWRHWYV